MKKNILILSSFVVLGSWLLVSIAFAAPERLSIQKAEKRAAEAQAKDLAKSVDLNRVSDPQVRTALRAIFDTLELQAKK